MTTQSMPDVAPGGDDAFAICATIAKDQALGALSAGFVLASDIAPNVIKAEAGINHRPVFFGKRIAVGCDEDGELILERRHAVECSCGRGQSGWHATEHDATLVWQRTHGQYHGWGPPVTSADFGVTGGPVDECF